MDLSVANHLAWSFRPKDSHKDLEEYLDCTWSLAVLQYHQMSVLPPLSFRESTVSPADSYAAAFPRLNAVGANARVNFVDAGDCQMSSGIQMVAAELGRVWQMARMYAAGRTTRDNTPPWMPNSDFADVMVEHLRWESTVPRKYRLSANRFDSYDLVDLQANRGYWSPWLHLQIVFAGIPCLLNHPFLLASRLQDFRHAMPQSFIQQSYEQITRHAGWIMYFIDLIRKKAYQVFDPVVAHCVLIVATIHLQHSFVEDRELSHRSQIGFGKCLSFLQNMGNMLPIAATFAERLVSLQSSISVRSTSDMGDGRRQQLWSIDTALLNDLLRYETAGQQQKAKGLSIKSNTLIPRAEALANDQLDPADEYDLVGSAGISGHRSVPREAPINAPGGSSDVFGSSEVLANSRQDDPNNSRAFDEPLFDEFMAPVGDSTLFLPANDHWRSIDDWLTLNAG